MSPAARALRLAVRGYRRWLSPLKPPTCRFIPTCSTYALEAVERHGALAGGWLAVRRVCRCHPWGGHGYDPVPDPASAPGADAGGGAAASGGSPAGPGG